MDPLVVQNLILILISVSFSAAGQTFLKLGLNKIPPEPERAGAAVLLAAAAQPFAWLGLVLFGFSVLLWMIVLSRSELSWAYPLLGLSYILVMASGAIFFGEQLTASRIAGTAFVLVGAVLIARS